MAHRYASVDVVCLPSGRVPENEALFPLPPEPLVKDAGTVRGLRLILEEVAVVLLHTGPPATQVATVVVLVTAPMEDNLEDEGALVKAGAVAATAKF